MKRVARRVRNYRELILYWFRSRKDFSPGVGEGLNNKAKRTIKKGYEYKSFRTLEIAWYHTRERLSGP